MFHLTSLFLQSNLMVEPIDEVISFASSPMFSIDAALPSKLVANSHLADDCYF